MKKQYLFSIIIFLIFYILYSIISFKYKELNLDYNTKYIINLNKNINNSIKNAYEIIEYKTSTAYKNKVAKSRLGYKNIGEEVVYLKNELDYKKYTQDNIEEKNTKTSKTEEDLELYGKTNLQKWILFIFGE